jgi:hypothetical protein
MMDERERDMAKLMSAVEAMRGMLAAALEAAHAFKEGDAHGQGEDYCELDRMLQLGRVVDIASALCPAQLGVLFAVAVVLQEIERGEGKQPSAENAAARQ